MGKRFAFDIGTNSLGWAVLALDDRQQPSDLIDLGVRVFDDGREPQKKTSLNEGRRLARGARRRRDRLLRRKADFMAALIDSSLMPADETARKALESLDPYALRRKGLDQALTAHELGRALFHLSQRRGFRSNRKANPGEDEDQGRIRTAIDATRQAMEAEGARTLGELLDWRHERREWVRARLRGEGARAGYVFYASRDLVAEEFDALWQAQGDQLNLDETTRLTLRDILLRQRDLRPPIVGFCTLEHGDPRAPWALPLTQRFRILKELATLEVGVPGQPRRRLTVDERDRLLERLRRSKTVTFDSMRRTLGLDADHRFNLESEKRTGLSGDETAARLAHKTAFGKAWHSLSLTDQTAVVERLLAEADEPTLVAWLIAHHGLDQAAAVRVARTALPAGHSRFGRIVLSDLVPVMQAEAEAIVDAEGHGCAAPLHESTALARLGRHHSDLSDHSARPFLPYYGEVLSRHLAGSGDARARKEDRWGRVPNPTVHIGLNQLRTVVNALIKAYGRPDQIIVELARELKQSRRDRDLETRRQGENQARNDRHRRELAELGLEDTGENRLRLRLWEELSRDPTRRCCVYSGRPISRALLFSPEVEVEHILPFRRTLDNGAANKTVSLREWNRLKGNRSPWEAFHGHPDWSAILARAQDLPGNKRWRFEPDAMDRFEGEQDFLARQLTDTQYLARRTAEYLGCLYAKDEGVRVWVTPGRLTAMLRGKWGLDGLLSDHNRKTRTDHRHHAIDAFVVGCTDRGLLNRVARAADETRPRLIEDMPAPWPAFRESLQARLSTVVASHKPDHGTQGRLHEDTAYGHVRDPASEGGCNLVFRKPVASLTTSEVGRIRDRAIRAKVLAWLEEAKALGLSHMQAMARFPEESVTRYGEANPVRRVRLLKTEAAVHSILDKSGHPYKALIPDKNHRIEIYERAGRWHGEGVTVLAANQAEPAPWRSRHPDARPVMVLHKGDLLETEVEGRRAIVRVVRLEVSARRVRVVGHTEAGDFGARDRDPEDDFGWRGWRLLTFARMQQTATRRVRVDPIGRIRPVPPPL
ncbi:type II CRISPR RNA-guided endonuclease Cas9 [Roseospira goensis]|uniref:CRISPR-associated endonuclease Cas9 n=1 Tax=Roseospira goensis TaxID=391922 RepID=A0A7W6RWE1_9PROT|nr:type II CRISPR RNA-guided endonuclease Cas9 [Roseospira goensis]MBB4284321.1 CRISPR-associated endonuclease Csn1 [Roseospira goensis]